MAYTLVGEKEQNKFASIEKLLEKEVEKAPVPADDPTIDSAVTASARCPAAASMTA